MLKSFVVSFVSLGGVAIVGLGWFAGLLPVFDVVLAAVLCMAATAGSLLLEE